MTARLQVLYLPTGGDGEARWALVIDQAPELDEADHEALRAFAVEAGAQGCVVLSAAVDLAQEDGGDEELAAQLADLVRTTATPPAQQTQKLPPPGTTEGKLARIHGGQKILDQMKEDPR